MDEQKKISHKRKKIPHQFSPLLRARIALELRGFHVPVKHGGSQVYDVLNAIARYEGTPRRQHISLEDGRRIIYAWLAKIERPMDFVEQAPIIRPMLRYNREMHAAIERCDPKKIIL